MKPCVDQWSIVVTGQWNPHILSAEWVAKHLLEEDKTNEIELQLAIIQGITSQIRLVTDDFILVPSRERIQFHPRHPSEPSIVKAEKAVLRTLDILSHTPVTGYGLNFRFEQELDDSSPDELFNAPDYVQFLEMGLTPVQRQIVRNIKVDNGFVLNLTLTQPESTPLEIGLNFHYPIGPDTDMKAFSREKTGTILPCYKKALEILETVYNLTLDVENESDD